MALPPLPSPPSFPPTSLCPKPTSSLSFPHFKYPPFLSPLPPFRLEYGALRGPLPPPLNGYPPAPFPPLPSLHLSQYGALRGSVAIAVAYFLKVRVT